VFPRGVFLVPCFAYQASGENGQCTRAIVAGLHSRSTLRSFFPSPACGRGWRAAEGGEPGEGFRASWRSALSRPILTAFGSSTLSRKRERKKGVCGSLASHLDHPFNLSNSHASSPACLGARAAPWSVAPSKKRGGWSAGRRWRVDGRARWPASRSSRSPENSAGDHRPIRGPARLPALHRGVFTAAPGRAFEQRRKRARRSSASSWQEAVVPPGGAPTQPECVLCVSTPAGAAPAKARNCRAPATVGVRLFSGASFNSSRHHDAS